MNLKVLPLERWMTAKRGRDECLKYSWRETFPYFYSEKQYLVGDNHIIEFVEDGVWKAYVNINGTREFKYRMEILNMKEYNQRQIRAMQTCVEEGVASGSQQRIVQIYQMHGRRDQEVMLKKGLLRFKKSLEKRVCY